MPAEENDLAKALANTYCPKSAATGWDRVQEYRRTIRYTAKHSDKGSSAVASALELPRGRIRPWMEDGSLPDPVRAIQVADMHGWLTRDWSYTVPHAVNVLVAWVYSGGSIEQRTCVPHFAFPSHLAKTVLERTFDNVGLDYRYDRADDDSRATEAVPAEHASIFGRTLVAWGAPVGAKHERRMLSLPRYLWNAPESVRLDFARTYLLNRGHARHDRPDLPIQIAEHRTQSFREELQSLFRSLVSDADAVRLSGETLLYLAPDAADELFMPPTFGE